MSHPTIPWQRALLAGLALSPLAGATQWQQQSPRPAPPQVQPRIAFLDAQRGYMGGFEPTPLETTAGGLSWHPAPIPGARYGLFFALDDQHAWALGNDQNARTRDGGATWESLPFLGLGNTVEFLTPDFGWAASNWAGAVTHDGGLTWQVAIIDSNTRVTYPDFRDAQVGLGREDDAGAIWRTSDGGATWQEVHVAPASSVAFVSDTVALAVGQGQIHRSSDAGLTWQTVHAGAGAARILVIDEQRVLVHGDFSFLLSTDGGLSWTAGEFGASWGVNQLLHVGGLELLAVGSMGDVLRSLDGGASWTRVREGTHVGLNDIELLPDGRLVAVGPAYVITSEDGGLTWTERSSGTGQHVYDLALWDGQRGLFCGSQAAVGTTHDGGAQWKASAPAWQFLGMNDVEALDLVGTSFGVLVGEAGAPLVTHDAGVSWSILPSFESSHALQSVDFVTEEIGWVGSVGPTARILRTSDGGQSFELQFGPTYGGIRALHMVDTSRGYALNGGERLLRTSDGGASWSESLHSGFGAVDLAFADAQHGWIVGDWGLVLRTDDGGTSWQAQSSGTGAHLRHVEVVSASEAWIAGGGNVLLHTSDGGASWEVVDVPAADSQQVWFTLHVGADGGLWLGGAYGVVMHLPGAGGGEWETYCSAKQTSGGCTPAIGAQGTPGVGSGAPFVVSANGIPSRQFGLFFYGLDGPDAAPFLGGTRCVALPIVRTPVQNAGGSSPAGSDCSGAFAFDVDAWIAAGKDAALVPGAVVHGQYWFRDPGDAFGSGLTDGIAFTLQP